MQHLTFPSYPCKGFNDFWFYFSPCSGAPTVGPSLAADDPQPMIIDEKRDTVSARIKVRNRIDLFAIILYNNADIVRVLLTVSG